MNKNWVLFWGVFLTIGIGLVFPLAKGLASIGVGVGTGKIIVDQPLKPGVIYTLPPVAVINTGDQLSGYALSVEYHAYQELDESKGLRPPAGWFSFDPPDFDLEPKEVKPVGVRLDLPVDAKPGKYFAYLEAHPIQRTEAGISAVRVAAAAQIWFTVVPANIWMGLYYRALSLYALYGPWVRLAGGIIILAMLITVAKRFFNFNVQLKAAGKQSSKKTRQKKQPQ